MAKNEPDFQALAEWVVEELPFEDGPDGELTKRRLVEFFAKDIEERYGSPVLPEKGQSLALSVKNRKTAALAFDRVYNMPGLIDPAPPSIGFYTATEQEIAFFARGAAIIAARKMGISTKTNLDVNVPKSVQEENSVNNHKLIASSVDDVLGRYPSIIYSSSGEFGGDFLGGAQKAIMRTFSEVCLVNEKSLTWDNIVEFRKDKEAKLKYRRLIRWVDQDLAAGRTESELVDIIDKRLEEYNWSLKKHGLDASIGAISAIVDPKALASSTALAGAGILTANPVLGLAVGAGVSLCQGAVKFGEILVKGFDERKKSNPEIAYVHDVRKKFGA